MKKLILITTINIFLFSCGNDSDKAKDIKLEHLHAYLYNNGYSELQMHLWNDSTATFSNDAYIFNKLHSDGHFTGAEAYESRLISLFHTLYFEFNYISNPDVQTTLKLITKTSGHPFVYFLVDKTKKEKFEDNNYFTVLPVTITWTVPELSIDTVYYHSTLNNLINEFNQKISDGTLTPSDTLIENDSMGAEVEFGEEGEIIAYLTMSPNKSVTKKETRKGQDKTTGEYFTADVDVMYSGKKKSWSKIRDYFLDINSNIYVTEDVEYVRNYNFYGRFPNSTENIKRIRLRKFDAEGILVWTFCGLPCSSDSLFNIYNDLSILSTKLIEDTLNVVIYEGNHSFSFNNYNGLKEFEVNKHVIKINPNNGSLYSFSPMNNDMYLEYTSAKANVNTEKLFIIEKQNILKEPYHVYKIGKSGLMHFYKHYDITDCDCVID